MYRTGQVHGLTRSWKAWTSLRLKRTVKVTLPSATAAGVLWSLPHCSDSRLPKRMVGPTELSHALRVLKTLKSNEDAGIIT